MCCLEDKIFETLSRDGKVGLCRCRCVILNYYTYSLSLVFKLVKKIFSLRRLVKNLLRSFLVDLLFMENNKLSESYFHIKTFIKIVTG